MTETLSSRHRPAGEDGSPVSAVPEWGLQQEGGHFARLAPGRPEAWRPLPFSRPLPGHSVGTLLLLRVRLHVCQDRW